MTARGPGRTAARRSDERGFAMLLVFVMAASVAIMLYLELPRVAFETQRNREELLIERGEQYQRAIQLYVRKFKKYPQRVEDLENTNQVRTLRRRYLDPMTGKDEWKLIQIEGGIYKNSLTKKPPKDEKKSVNTFTYEATGIGQTQQPTGENASAAPRVRESERNNFGRPPISGQAPPAANPDAAQQQQQQQPGYGPAGYPGQQPQQPGVPGATVIPAQWRPLMGQGVQQGNMMQPAPDAYASPQAAAAWQKESGQAVYGMPNPQAQQQQQASQNTFTGNYSPPAGNNQQAAAFGYRPPAGAQGGYGYGYSMPISQPGLTPATQSAGQSSGANPAIGLIQQILTSPRQGGMPQGANPMANAGLGNGIAGVASTVERRGIKVYNEREFYNQWEFIYDPAVEQQNAAAGAGGVGGAGGIGTGTAAGRTGQSGQTGMGFGGGGGTASGSFGFGSASSFSSQSSTSSGSSPFTGGGGSANTFTGNGPFTGSGSGQSGTPQTPRQPGTGTPNQPGYSQPGYGQGLGPAPVQRSR